MAKFNDRLISQFTLNGLLVIFGVLLYLFFPLGVNASSYKDLSNYMVEAVKNKSNWTVTNDKSAPAYVKIEIKMNNNSNLREAFEDSKNSGIALIYCNSDSSCNESEFNKVGGDQIEFDIKKEDGTIKLVSEFATLSAYNKIIQDGRSIWWQTSVTEDKFFLPDKITKNGTITLVNSVNDNQDNQSSQGTTGNPYIVRQDSTIPVPSRNDSYWDSSSCVYFKIDLSSINETFGRYTIEGGNGISSADEPLTIAHYIWAYGNSSPIYSDAAIRTYYGLTANQVYCISSNGALNRRQNVRFIYKDSDPLTTIDGGQNDLVEDQIGDENTNTVSEEEWEELSTNLDPSNFNNEIGCPDIIDVNTEGSLGWLLVTILNYIRILGPVLVVLLSAIDFIKAVVGFDEKAMKEAQNKLIIRLVAAVALFLVPTLVQLLLSFINETTCTL